MKRYFTLFIFLISYSASILAQASLYEQYEREDLTMQDFNEVLGVLGKTIISFEDESLRIENNEVFRTFLKRAIEQENSFEYDFDSVRTMSIIKSEDQKLRIYNWAFPYENGTYTFYGFVQLKTESGYRVIELYDQSDIITSYKYRSFYPEKWFGALYYNILTRTHNDKTYYTLLGWDGNTTYTTKKIIDVLTIKHGEELEFGSPIFDLHTNVKPRPKRIPPAPYRMVYEFASMVSMKLNWDDKERYIIMDHLSPLTSDKKEFAKYYGPDLTFDAFRWIDGKWSLFENVKAANQNRVPEKKPYKRKNLKLLDFKKTKK
ncbi:MAG: hypothetical protein ABFR62_05620 [Bacteroidota bacterium]